MILLQVAIASLFPSHASAAVDLARLNSLLKASIAGDSPVKAHKHILDAAIWYVPYAGLSYCPDDRVLAMNCNHCKKVSADFHSFVTNRTTTTHSVILVDKRKKEIVLSIRGSENFGKALSLATLDFVDYPYFDKEAKVHATTMKYMTSILTEIVTKLSAVAESNSGFQITIVGHSLGGAIANLLSPILFNNLRLNKSQLLMVSYGQPRVGDRAFVDQYNSLGFPFLRVVNEHDAISRHPPRKLGFLHIPNEINFQAGKPLQCRNQELEDPKCSNTRAIPAFVSQIHSSVGDLTIGSDGC